TTWLKTLDHKINYKTEPLKYENEVEKNGGLNVKQVLENFYNENINEVETGHFVKKHIDYKHHSTVDTTMNDARFYNNYVLDPNHLLPTTPPNPTAALVPQSVTPIPPSPFPVMTNAPPPPFMNFSFPIMGAAAGTPHDQIPRIGFDGRDDSRE
ncbi:12413_t:CDS:2, partial [Racocetra persica]